MCVEGLNITISAFIQQYLNGSAPEVYRKRNPLRVIFNNFEMSALKFWKSEQYQTYINHVDRAGGFYYHRWGDAPIKTAAVFLLLPESEIRLLTGFQYKHY